MKGRELLVNLHRPVIGMVAYCFLGGFVWLGLALLPVMAGEVVTVDGQKLEGTIHFTQDNQLAIETSSGQQTVIAPDKLASARFDPPARSAGMEFLTPDWQAADIGAADRPGEHKVNGDSIWLSDGGKWIGRKRGEGKDESEDSLRFVYKTLRGPGQIVARVRPQNNNESWGKIGLMFRESLDPNAPFAMAARTERWHSQVLARESQGKLVQAGALTDRGVMGAAWLKLVREGYSFSGFESVDGSDWISLGSMPVLVPEDAPLLVGVAAAGGPGHEDKSANQFDHVAITAVVAPGTSLAWVTKGLLSRSGSALATEIVSGDRNRFVYNQGGAQREVACADIAWLALKHLSPAQQDKLASCKPGALLFNGDFVEGDFQRLEQDQVTLSSVLFGIRQYNRQAQLAAIVLRQPEQAPCTWTVALHNHSKLRAETISIQKDRLQLTEPVFGVLEISLADLAEIRKTSQ